MYYNWDEHDGQGLLYKLIIPFSSISKNKFTILVNFYIYFRLPLLFRVYSIWIFNFFSLFYNFYHFLIFQQFVLVLLY